MSSSIQENRWSESLVIVAPAESKQQIEDLLIQYAGMSWDSDGRIRILSVDAPNDPFRIASMLKNLASRHTQHTFRAVVVGSRATKQAIEERLTRGDVYLIGPPQTHERFRNNGLKRILQSMNLDLIGRAQPILDRWGLASIDQHRIDNWLNQFELCGNNRWIGERLLGAVDVIASNQIAELLGVEHVAKNFNHFCIIKPPTPGKSADAIAVIVRKRLKTSNGANTLVSDLSTTLSATPASDSIVLFEDGIFSGTEQLGVFDSLLGQRALNRSLKTAPLPNRNQLDGRLLELRFAIAADLGLEHLRTYLQTNKLQHVRVPEPMKVFKVLTDRGRDAIADGRLLNDSGDDGSLADLSFVEPWIFKNPKLWASDNVDKRDRRLRAFAFCRDVGKQLWSSYLSEMGWSWPDRRVEECGLGMRSIGLALAFPHSVPKATIPLFWAHGKVRFQCKTLDWEPLFPHAY